MKLFGGIVLLLAIFPPGLKAQDTDTVNAELVGQKVQEALLMASATGLGGLILNKAVLTLEVGQKTQGGITINLLIFKISSKRTKGSTETITLNFAQSPKAAVKPPSAGELKDSLAGAIVAAAGAASKVNVLPLKEATIKLGFAVDTDASGGVKFQLLGADFGGSIDSSKTSMNSLTVTFTK